jgi:hypothetical protein
MLRSGSSELGAAAIGVRQIPVSYESMTPEWLTAVMCRDQPEAKVVSFALDSPDNGTSNRRRRARRGGAGDPLRGCRGADNLAWVVKVAETYLDRFAGSLVAHPRQGLAPGVVSIIPGGREVGQYPVAHPGIDKVSVTGSTTAGRVVGSVCGEQIKPVTLEFGGKSAAIALDDVDLDKELPALINSSMPNNDPHQLDTECELLVPARQRERVEAYIKRQSKIPTRLPEDPNLIGGCV